MALPYTFGALAGNVPASYLDDNFNYLLGLITDTSGPVTIGGALTTTGQINLFNGFINPTPAVGQNNDYAPTGYDTANYVRLATTAGAVVLTGFAAGTSVRGRTILLENNTGQVATLMHNNAGSAAANRFFCPNSMTTTLGLGQTAFLVYTGGGWRVIAMSVREVLQANRTYFVATTGNDTNDGLTAATPLLTVQRAITVAQQLDFNGFAVTVSVADGTYSGNANAIGPFVGQRNATDFVIQGNITTPANVVFNYNTPGGSTIQILGARAWVRGIKFVGATLFAHLVAGQAGRLQYSECEFGASGNYHLYAGSTGSLLIAFGGGYTISGGAQAHYAVVDGAQIQNAGQTVTLTGTPAFSIAFALANLTGYITAPGVTFSGSATGPRYSATNGGAINTNSGGANYFPGNVAGTATSPGWYA